MAKNRIYDIKQWLVKLHNAGHDVYYHCNLPDELKNSSMQQSAIRSGAVKKTGNTIRYGSTFVNECRIPDDIENISINRKLPW